MGELPTIRGRLAKVLDRGFRGPRPGSNVFVFVELAVEGETLAGEDVETIRGGDCGPFGEVPDIECTHVYRLTPLGRERFIQP